MAKTKTETPKKEVEKSTSVIDKKGLSKTPPKSKDEIVEATRKENVTIELKFTEAEIGKRGQQLAKALQEIGVIEAEKKASNESFKSKIDAKQGEIEILTEQISSGFEMKLVSANVIKNFTSGLREYHYEGKKVKEERLGSTDHQLELVIKEPKVVKMDIKISANDFVVTKSGMTVQITEEDIVNGVKFDMFERLASQVEIESFIKDKK